LVLGLGYPKRPNRIAGETAPFIITGYAEALIRMTSACKGNRFRFCFIDWLDFEEEF